MQNMGGMMGDPMMKSAPNKADSLKSVPQDRGADQPGR